MLPSSTVENYLKAIYHGVSALPETQRLLPMGQLATALGVTPGTATTMVKTLAESGLVDYEPYAGVRLTASGETLAALVLRRHRLVELFLVQVMGLRWDEVHDEAEILEHAMSDRLIDRMDEMLGRPEADPHGDPIPDPRGVVKRQDAQSLLTCPLGVPVTVTRIIDQDKAFLRFVEGHDLKPGESIEVEERDAASDSVRVRGKHNRSITIGTRAASKLLVQVARALVLLLVAASSAFAQGTQPSGSARPWEILDNSFFVEEAFNQDAGTFQNIAGVARTRAGWWMLGFTQEWALFSHAHQLSYTVGAESAGIGGSASDTLINYRFQALDESATRPAFSPRFSVILPSGSRERRTGGDAGWQLNLPISKQAGDFYFHGNAGVTRVAGSSTPIVGASAIWRAKPMMNVMLEAINSDDAVVVAPGVRGGWNSNAAQTVVGLAVPITRRGSDTSVGLFGYFSYELPFTRRP